MFTPQKRKNNNILKTVVFAYHNMGIAGLEALIRHGYEIGAVFTHEDDPCENCWFGSVKEWALRRTIAVFTPEGINSREWIEKIKSFQPDTIFSFYYRKMIPAAILAIPRVGAFNLHGSLLPKYRGRCPVNWVLINGEKKTGVTLHYMIDKPDAGDIVGQKEVPIDFEDTAKTLYDKLCLAAASLLQDLLPGIKEGKINRRSQNLSEGSYYGGRKPEDGRIDWNKGADEIYNLVRAVTYPYPGAFAYRENNEKMIIWQAIPGKGDIVRIPGAINVVKEEVLVQTGKNAIKLLSIETEGMILSGGKQISDYFIQRKVTSLK